VSALLLPKCPLCVVAWAATLGVGTAGQQLMDWFDQGYRPALVGLLTFPLLLQIGLALHSRMHNGRALLDALPITRTKIEVGPKCWLDWRR